MKITSEQFKDIICKVNRISPTAKITFRAKVWHGTREESEFDIEHFSQKYYGKFALHFYLKYKIVTKFKSDETDRDEVIIYVK